MKKSRIIAGAVLCAALAGFMSCQKNEAGKASSGKASSNKLVVWSFTDEIEG